MDSKNHLREMSCPLGVFFPFTNPHSINSSCLFCGTSAPIQAHVSINRSSLGLTCPILECVPIALCNLSVNLHDFSWVCRWGHLTYLVRGCFRGKMGLLHGHAPMLPLPFPNAAQISINHSKTSKLCAPLVSYVTICTKGAPSHTQTSLFSQPITPSL
jgi:hypothetical protein